jgi:hypothetical protein
MTHPKPAADPALDAGMRRWGTVLKLWRLCGNASCRRARACRGCLQSCGRRNYALLPDGVRGWFELLSEAKEEGLSFAEVRDWLEGTAEEEAFRDWSAAVKGSLR